MVFQIRYTFYSVKLSFNYQVGLPRIKIQNVLKENTVQNLSEKFFTLPHPVGGVVLVQHLVVVAEGDDEEH